MIQMHFVIDLKYEIADNPADFIFHVHAAHTAQQSVVAETVSASQSVEMTVGADPQLGNRVMRLTARPGLLALRYEATVDIAHHFEPPARLEEVPIGRLPSRVLPFLYPSRYVQSDRLHSFAAREFGHLRPGYWRVVAIRDWVARHTAFASGSSDGSTSALDTLVTQAGVCRDFSHLMIALCRAVNIPARFVTGIDYGAAPALGPPDFHAYVEVFLGSRWYMFDPTGISPPMGLVRIGTGRDAADVAFATMFGAVKTSSPMIVIDAVDAPGKGYVMPTFSLQAISSHDEPALA